MLFEGILAFDKTAILKRRRLASLMEAHFTTVYESKIWGDNGCKMYCGSSGGGSDIEVNKDVYIPLVRKFIEEHGIKEVVDLGCGDCRCLTALYDDLDILYTGYDAYEKVVNHNSNNYLLPKYKFIHSDFYSNRHSIGDGDLCILKDVLQHWQPYEIYTLLDYLTQCKKFKYILITNCCNQTKDDPENAERSTPLSAEFLPLKKYGPKKLARYTTKEVSVIQIF